MRAPGFLASLTSPWPLSCSLPGPGLTAAFLSRGRLSAWHTSHIAPEFLQGASAPVTPLQRVGPCGGPVLLS